MKRRRKSGRGVPACFLVLGLLGGLWGLRAGGAQTVSGVPGLPTARAVVSFGALADFARKHSTFTTNGGPWGTNVVARAEAGAGSGLERPPRAIHAPMPLDTLGATNPPSGGAPEGGEGTSEVPKGPRLDSPPPATGFEALLDNNTVIPPDTMGAVGPNHLMVTLNSEVRIQNRTGGEISRVPLDVFWSALGFPSVFDPKVYYDAGAGRFIFVAMADGNLPSSSVLIGVSRTSDPTGLWNLFRIDADPLNFDWADFPCVGFNGNWIVVTANMFSNLGNLYGGARVWVFNKADLYANGTGAYTLLQDGSGVGFTMMPAVTLDSGPGSANVLYLVEVDNLINNFNGVSARLRLSTISGPVGAEVLTLGVGYTPATNIWGSSDPFRLFGGSLPQLGSPFGISGNDCRMSGVVFRNGTLWCVHHVFLPAFNPSYTAVQWWQLATNGTVLQFARLEDPTGTVSYAYPSLAVNARADVLIGFSRFSPNEYASAAYTVRLATDPPSTLRVEQLLKAGEAPYFKTFGGFRNRWGDYSATMVDPVDDVNFWTIQEYAASPAGGIDRWGTWWGYVVMGNVTQFRYSQYSVREGAAPGVANISVYNFGGAPGTVDFSTSDGTAVAGIDYVSRAGTLVFAPGQVETNFDVIILDNGLMDGDRTVNLHLRNPSGGLSLGMLSNAVLTIVDDEAVPMVSTAGEFNFSAYVDGTFYEVTENETINFGCGDVGAPVRQRSARAAVITVVRTNGASGRVLVDYETALGGTAVPLVDYMPTNGTLVFDDYQMSTNFTVQVMSDYVANGHKFVRLRLSNPRPDPQEELHRPGMIRPTLGPGAESGLYILEINHGYCVPSGVLLTNFTCVNAFAMERRWYRADEYPNRDPRNVGGVNTIQLSVILPLGGPGDVDVVFPNLAAGFQLHAGSDYALSPAGGAITWPQPVFTTNAALSTIVDGADYEADTVRLRFGQGQCRANVTLTINNDQQVEFNEDVIVLLRRVPNNPPVNPDASIANVTILHDDQAAGALDREWNIDNVETTVPPFNETPGANNIVAAVAVQPDGKTVLGGDFSAVNGRARNRIARLNFDGSLDTSFEPGTGFDGLVSSLLIYPGTSTNAGRILVGGGFLSFNGFQRSGVARLLPNGSLDGTFFPGNGTDGPVRAMAFQSDGRILIAGNFTRYNDQPRNGIARLLPDGSLDPTFDGGDGPDGTIWTLAVVRVLAEERIVIGGDFLFVNQQYCGGIARLRPDGSLDPGFDPGGSADGPIYAIGQQSDGSLIVAGAFFTFDVQPRVGIARLFPDGALDPSFDPGGGVDNPIYALAIQPNDQVIIGGPFSRFNGTRRMGLARLRRDGSLDTSFMDTAYNQFAGLPHVFSFEPPNYVNAMAFQPDGNLIIGGSFTSVGGNPSYLKATPNHYTVFTRADKRPRYNIARILNGVTPGPGNAEYDQEHYYIDEHGGVANVRLQRTDGRLGTLMAEAGTTDRTATNLVDYLATNLLAVWPYQYYQTNIDIQFGIVVPTNFAPLSIGRVEPFYLRIPILEDQLKEGDELLDLSFVRPLGEIFLGGEYVPLGGALGRARANLAIADNDFDAGIFNFSMAQFVTNENAVNAIVTVIRTNGSVGDVSVEFFTTSDTLPPVATPEADYRSVRGTLPFASGQTSRTFLVPIINDSTVEFEENIGLVLTNATGGAKLPGLLPTSTATARITIVDDDYPPGRLNFAATGFTTNENAPAALITVTRTGGNSGAVSVQFRTASGTAIQGLDYLGTNGTLTWNHLESTPKTFHIPLLPDGRVDGPKTVLLFLTNASPSAQLFGLRTNATLVLTDDDACGAYSFNQSFYQADENGGVATITVVRRGGLAETNWVDYSVAPVDPLSPGYDYLPTGGTLEFRPGESSKTFDILLLDENESDGNKDLVLTLSNPRPACALLGTPSMVLLTLVDDESFNIPAGSLDTSFSTLGKANGPVYALALQPDGRLLLAGDFTEVSDIPRSGLARLLPDGRFDASFDPGSGANGAVRAMALQPDGRVLIAGLFTQVQGTNRARIARLHFDGTLDAFFNPGAGANNPVYALALQADEKVLIGGSFTTVNGLSRPGVARLDTNGAVDVSFSVGAGPNGTIYALAVQRDGRILIGGDFTQFNGTPRHRLARLNPNGTLDTTFDPGAGFDGTVRTLLVQPDGRILAGGSFTNVNGVLRRRLCRLNTDGSLDPTFLDGVEGGNDTVYALARQVDGKLLVGGDFTLFNGVTRNRLTRLTTDGRTDPTINFGSGANGFVTALVIQPDRRIVIGGGFTTYDDQPRDRLARIYGGSITGPGRIEYSQPLYTVNEDGFSAFITVRRIGGTEGTVAADFSTAPESAVEGLHYAPTNGTLTFVPGETRRHFAVRVFDTPDFDGNRTLRLNLVSFTGGATAGFQPFATLFIFDSEVGVGFATPFFSVNENVPSGVASIGVVRAGNTNSQLTVDFFTELAGSATPFADYVPTNGTVLFRPGETLKYLNVPIVDDPDREGVEFLTLTLTNLAPTNAGQIVLSNATLYIVDDEFAPGEIGFAAATYAALETDGYAAITLLRRNGSSGLVSVEYSAGPGSNTTATPWLDYQPVTGTLAFADGETNKTFFVPIFEDGLPEPDETVNLLLSRPSGGATLGASAAQLTIIDDAPPPSHLGFTATNFVVREAQLYAEITVIRTNSRRGVVEVQLSASDGTAVAGADYLNEFYYQTTNGTFVLVTNGLVRLPANQSFTNVYLLLVDDTTGEFPETVLLTLANAWSPSFVNPAEQPLITQSNAWLTIRDSEFTFESYAYTVLENIGAAQFNILRPGPTNTDYTVDYETMADGTAIAGVDFTDTRGTLFWTAGDTTPQTIMVPIIDNNVVNPDKTFSLLLHNARGQGPNPFPGDPFRSVVTIQNDEVAQPPAGSVDPGFNAFLGANATVHAVAFDAQQRLYAGGEFTLMHGQFQNHIARLTSNGVVDAAFVTSNGFDGPVYALLPNGNEVVVGGSFTNYNGRYIERIAVLQENGQPSAVFNPTNGADGPVYALGLAALATTNFARSSLQAVNNSDTYVIQLGANQGEIDLDATFSPVFTTNGAITFTNTFVILYDGLPLWQTNLIVQSNVVAFSLQDLVFGPGVGTAVTIVVNGGSTNGGPWNYAGVITIGGAQDRKIYIGGAFLSVNGQPQARVARLDPSGALDLNFNVGSGANGNVHALAVLTNGQVLAAGDFTSFDGILMPRIVRLNDDGTVDLTFNPGLGPDGRVRALAVQPDGRILVAGDFTAFNGVPHAFLTRLLPDGEVDLSFDPGAGPNGPVYAVALQEDGRVLIAGGFTAVDGNSFTRLARLYPDGAVDATFNPGAGADALVRSLSLTRIAAPPLLISRANTGGATENRLIIETGATNGVITMDYNFLFVPNNVRVYYAGALIFDLTTNGIGTLTIPYGPGPSTLVTIVMNEGGGQPGAIWSYTLSIQAGGFTDTLVGIGGDFTTVNNLPRQRVAVLTSSGAVYDGFGPGAVGNIAVYSIAQFTNRAQPALMGKLLVGGDFTSIAGALQNRIARLNLDGSVDTNFTVGLGANGAVRAVAVQPDGRSVIGGHFTNVNNFLRNYLARLETNGAVDLTFNAGVGLDGPVNALALQADGKIVVGGQFTRVYGASRNGIARVHANGTVDTSFAVGSGANGPVRAVVLQPDGKVLIGGDFTAVNGAARGRIARLLANGALDTSFNPPAGANDSVNAIALQSDGRILIGGAFTSVNGTNRSRLARLEPSGALDLTFDPGAGADDVVSALLVQPDGRVLVAGGFVQFNRQTHRRIVRLNADGSIDPTINFGTGANDFIAATLLQDYDGKIVIGGAFTEVNGQPRVAIARLFGGANAGAGAFEFSASAYAVSEDTNAVLTLLRTGGTSGAATVDFATRDLTAVAGVDYVATAGTVAFASGEVEKTITIPLLDNALTNQPRSFNVLLLNPTGGASLGPQSVTRVDLADDDAVVSFSGRDFTVNEGVPNARISVVRVGGNNRPLTVDCLVGTNGTATPFLDYLPLAATLIFNPGVSVQTLNVPISDDVEIEPPETVPLLLSNLVGPASLGLTNATLRIVDNDIGPGVLSFTTNAWSVIENMRTLTVSVMRTGGISGQISVRFTTVPDTATAGADFVSTNGVLTFADGETNKTFVIQVLDDSNVEGSERLFLQLFGATGGATIGQGLSVLTIVDDDSFGSLVFSEPLFTVVEGVPSALVHVRRIGGTNGAVSVTAQTSGGTATPSLDYTAVSNVLNFLPGQTNAVLTVPILDDAFTEGTETVGLLLSDPTGGATIGAQGTATLLIYDNELSLTLSAPAYFVAETGLVAVVEALRIGNTNGAVSVTAATTPGTAGPADYVSTNVTVAFAPGETNKVFHIRILDDTLPEGEEYLNLTLSSPSAGTLGPIVTARIFIGDNDSTLSFSAATYTVTESFTNVEIRVVRAGATNTQISVQYATSDGTATSGLVFTNDYFAAAGVLDFPPGVLTNSFFVTVLDDTLAEGNETVNLALFNPLGGATLGGQATAVLNILDNDVAVGFAVTNFIVNEKATNATITLVRKGLASGAVSVTFVTSNGTALAGQDYTRVSNVVTWAHNDMTPKTVLVPVTDDALLEGSETVQLLLLNPTGGAYADPAFATLAIVDNAGSIAFDTVTITNYIEGDDAILTLRRTGGTNGTVTVDYAFVGGTATPGVDFLNATGTVAFADGEAVKSIALPLYTNGVPGFSDGVIEGIETIRLGLFNATGGARVGDPNQVTLTVQDRDLGVLVGAGSALVAESGPTNNVIDPNEVVTLQFALRNIGVVNANNLRAILLATNGVAMTNASLSVTQNYGTVIAGGASVSRPFTFRATGTNGGRIVATLVLVEAGFTNGVVNFTYTLGSALYTFANANAITIQDNAGAVPYPSVIRVSGVNGPINKLTVGLHGLSHSYVRDVDVLLVGPRGQKVLLMSDVGGSPFTVNNLTLTFDDAAASPLPLNTPLTSGTYRPANYDAASESFPVPPPPYAPLDPPYNTNLAVFNGTDPNGDWQLYVVDDTGQDSGVISAGWSLTINSAELITPVADLSVRVTDAPDPVVMDGLLTYTIAVTNHGPAAATGVTITNWLPAGTVFFSASTNFGPVTHANGVVTASLGTLTNGGAALVLVSVTAPPVPGTLTNVVSVGSAQTDVNLGDNIASVKTIVASIPQLVVQPKGTNIVLSWPAGGGNYTLESTPSLRPATWEPVGATPALINGQFTVSLPISPAVPQRFYRLRWTP